MKKEYSLNLTEPSSNENSEEGYDTQELQVSFHGSQPEYHTIIPEGTEVFIEHISVEKTALMQNIESQHEDTPIQEILFNRYHEQKMSILDISKEINVTQRTIILWMREFGIQARPSISNPASESNRIEEIHNAWDERKDEIVSKIHTPSSDKKRADTMKKRLEEVPGFRSQQLQYLELARTAHQKKTEVRRREQLGHDPQGLLRELHHEQGLSLTQIQKQTGLGYDHIRYMMRQYDIDILPSTSPVMIRKYQEFMEHIWKNPQNFHHLSKRQKEVLTKAFLTDGPIPNTQEIAEKMGLSAQQTVYLHLNRALKNLKNRS